MEPRPHAIGFDLDYTLLDQDAFVRSFYDAIAADLGRRLHRGREEVAKAFHGALDRLTIYHPRLFDEALRELMSWDARLVAELVERYHRHRPEVHLYAGAEAILHYLKDAGYRLFLVTDGNSETQRYKVQEAGIGCCFEQMVFTGDFSREQRKPSVFPFTVVCGSLRLPANECVYVGDNPQCDFEGPKELGMRTIGVSTGPFAEMLVTPRQAPDLRISRLEELRGLF